MLFPFSSHFRSEMQKKAQRWMHVQGYVLIIFKTIELTMLISKMENLSFLRFMQLGLQSLNKLTGSFSKFPSMAPLL